MLFTRCPDCETTFRITAEALRKAEGQVRCGRCACVFDAYAELRRGSSESPEAVRGAAAASTSPSGGASVTTTVPEAASPAAAKKPPSPAPENAAPADQRNAPSSERDQAAARDDSAGRETAAEPAHAKRSGLGNAATAGRDDANGFGGVTLASVIDELRSSEQRDDEEAANAREDRASDEGAQPPPAWIILGDEDGAERKSRGWIVGCAFAAALLAGQLTHHFRTQIAANTVVGPWLQEAYAVLGSDVEPHWDLDQYEIVDWTAIAEPNANGRGSLKIAARIRNRGPRAQPFPLVHVQLKDRWESTVGSRMFTPEEYSSSDSVTSATMRAGQTERAELDIVDPGPDAYGFELDVCIEAGAGTLRCAADDVFR